MAEKEHKTVWLVDPVHTRIRFEAKYLLMTAVSGWFTQFEGSVVTLYEGFADSRIQLTVYTHSLFTANEQRDGHLRSAEFFDTSNFPILTFVSSSVIAAHDKAKVTGELCIKGVTRTVDFEATFMGICHDPMGNTKAGFEMTIALNRKDYDITWNQTFDKSGILISDEVKVFCDVQLLRMPATSS